MHVATLNSLFGATTLFLNASGCKYLSEYSGLSAISISVRGKYKKISVVGTWYTLVETSKDYLLCQDDNLDL